MVTGAHTPEGFGQSSNCHPLMASLVIGCSHAMNIEFIAIKVAKISGIKT